MIIWLIILTGCGTSNYDEQFLDNAVVSWSSDTDLINQILADGKVSRAETVQAIEAKYQCYERNGLAGKYSYDLDLYPWVWDEYTHVSKDNPAFSQIPDPYRSDSDKQAQWLSTDEGKAWLKKEEDVQNSSIAKCSMFDQVENTILSQTDLDVYADKQYDAKVQCIRTNASSYARRVQDSWPKGEEGLKYLFEEFQEDIASDNTDSAKLRACMQLTGSKVEKTFGETVLD